MRQPYGKPVRATVLCVLAACGGEVGSTAAASPAASPAPNPAASPVGPVAVPPPDPAEFSDQGVRTALLTLAEALPGTSGSLRYERRAGPQGVDILRVVAVGGAPGSGVVSVLRADGHTVGIHGERSFAELVRERGWRESPPPASDLSTLADAACFDGMGALRAVAVTPGATLRIAGRLFEPPAPAREVVIEIGASGPEQILRPTR